MNIAKNGELLPELGGEMVWLVYNGYVHLGIREDDGTTETNCSYARVQFKTKVCQPKKHDGLKMCLQCLSLEVELTGE